MNTSDIHTEKFNSITLPWTFPPSEEFALTPMICFVLSCIILHVTGWRNLMSNFIFIQADSAILRVHSVLYAIILAMTDAVIRAPTISEFLVSLISKENSDPG